MYNATIRLAPFILATIAFISAFRTFLWLTDQIEGKISARFKSNSIQQLNKWWQIILDTKIPYLAKNESSILLEKYNLFLENKKMFNFFKLKVSIFLTSAAYLIGHVIYIISLSIEYYNSGTAKEFNDGFVSALFVNPIYFPAYIFLIVSMYRYSRNEEYRTWDIYRIFTKFSLFSIALHIVHHAIIEDSISTINIVLFFVLLSFMVFADFGFKQENRNYVKNVIILLVFTLFLVEKHLFYFLLSLILLYGVNFLADGIVISFSVFSLKKIATGKIGLSILIIGLGLMISFILSILVLFLVLGSLGVKETDQIFPFVSLLVESLKALSLGLSSGMLFSYLKDQFIYSASNNTYCIFLYSITTFLPIFIFSLIWIFTFSGKILYISLGRFSRFLFYKDKVEDRKSAVHITLVILSFWISFIPGIVAYQTSLETVQKLTA